MVKVNKLLCDRNAEVAVGEENKGAEPDARVREFVCRTSLRQRPHRYAATVTATNSTHGHAIPHGPTHLNM